MKFFGEEGRGVQQKRLKIKKIGAGGVKQILNSLNYEKQMFVKVMTLVTIPLIVMGFVSCNLYIRSESTKSELILDSYSVEASREYENILTAIKEYYIETVNDESFRWLLRQEEIPYSRYTNLKKAQKILEGNYFFRHYIKSYNFTNMNYRWILNNYGMFPYENMKNTEQTETFLEEQSRVESTVYWVNRPNVSAPMDGSIRLSNSVDSSGFQLIIKNMNENGDLAWLLAIQLDERQWKNLAENYKSVGYEISILGGVQKTALLETSAEMTEEYLRQQDESYKPHWRSEKYRTKVKQDETNGITYVVGYDTTKVRRDATVFVFASFAVIAGFALLLLAVRLMTVAFAKPLYRLQKYVDDQNMQLKEILVSSLIRDELTPNRIEETMKKLEIVPCQVYRMLTLLCKGERSEEEGKEQYARILADFPQHLRQQIFITPISYKDKLVFLIGAESEAEIDTKTAVLYKEIKDYIRGRFNTATAAGISRTFCTLGAVMQAYNECKEALYHKSNQEDAEISSLVLFDDSLTASQGNVYDMIMENELIQAIESCKEEDATHLLELIIERMEAKGVVGIERNFYLTRLLTAMLTVPVAAGLPLSDVFESERYNVLNQMPQIYEKKKLVASVKKEMIQPIIKKLSEKMKEGDEPEIVRQMMELIWASKGNLSLNECADKLNYHPNYLSKVLKREKGVTFTDIANEEKLKQAKYMLLTTEYSVGEISEKLQYNNVQNFIRFFKNHVGETPAAFRKEHRK